MTFENMVILLLVILGIQAGLIVDKLTRACRLLELIANDTEPARAERREAEAGLYRGGR